jgi:hypothetical protein
VDSQGSRARGKVTSFLLKTATGHMPSVAAAELSSGTSYVIRGRAIFNFDIGQVGGILETKKIAAMAEAHDLQIAPHRSAGR